MRIETIEDTRNFTYDELVREYAHTGKRCMELREWIKSHRPSDANWQQNVTDFNNEVRLHELLSYALFERDNVTLEDMVTAEHN